MKPFRWTEDAVMEALQQELSGEREPLAGEGPVFRGVSTDTRSISEGDLFVALQGVRFDAHAFLGQAAEAGAAGAVVSYLPEDAPTGLRYFHVENTLTALGALARYRRLQFDARVVGVVGSNGKTTTKELLRAALGARYRVHATQGNLNNQIGVPLTLLAAPDDAEVLVVEMGTNEPGEIEILTAIVRPDAGVVTSIGEEHLEKLGSLEGVLQEEASLLAGLGPEGIGYVAEEPAALPERARELRGERVRVAGFSQAADLRPEGGADAIHFLPDGSTRWTWKGTEVHLPLPGRYNVRNALLALGVSREWGVPAADAAAALGRARATKLRGEWHRIGDLRVLADCYNSNPPSVAAATELLTSIPAEGRKIVVLGTMRELGTASEELHRQTASAVAEHLGDEIDVVIATGAFVEAFRPLAGELGDRLVSYEDPLEAYAAVSATLDGNETILLKASRGEELERWIPLLERDRERKADAGGR